LTTRLGSPRSRTHAWLRLVVMVLLAPVLASCWLSGGSPQPAAGPSTVPGAVPTPRYVSPSGRDTWPGTEARPWRTLARALPALTPGATLYVRGGTYREHLVRLNVHVGTPAHRILVTAYPGERPVVEGVLWLFRPSYWTIDAINVTWDDSLKPAPLHMVKVTGGVGWSWQNSEIWGSKAAANVLITGYGRTEPSRWRLTGNCIHDLEPPTRRSANLTIGPMKDAGPGSVTRNLLFNAPGPQNVAFGRPRAGGPNGVDFSYNTLFGSKVGLAFAGDVRNVTVERNIVAGVTSGLAVRWTVKKESGNSIRQNLGVDARRFMRPAAELKVGGPGNVLRDDVTFRNTSSCRGFTSTSPATFPYGRGALG